MKKHSKITKFFKTNENTQSSESDSDIVLNELESDIKEYEKILKNRKELQEKSKIVLNKITAGGSPVWYYFGQMTTKNVVVLQSYLMCKKCFEETPLRLKGFSLSTSTSNLINHLRSAHRVEISSNKFQTSESKTKSVLCKNSNALEKPTSRRFANTRLLVQMCCRDLRPFNIVEQPGFIDYIKAIKPSITMPVASTLSRSALEDVYSTYYKTIKQFISVNCPKTIALVLDMWTDSYKKRSFINIRILFPHDFEPICISLKTDFFSHPHNKYTISKNILETLENFDLQQKNIVVVSDGGSNIVAAVKLIKMNRLTCSSHSLHRFIVHDILNNKHFTVFSNTVSKLKQVYKCLNYSAEKIMNIQKVYEGEQLIGFLNEASELQTILEVEEQFVVNENSFESLKNSNDTRWNTLCYMLKSFHTNQRLINVALAEIGKTDLALNSMEKNMMDEFLNFLKIFEEATKYLQGRKYPTINNNIVFFEKIMKNIEQSSETVSFEETINMCSFAKENFHKRFKIYKIHLVAALLDPIQKNWKRLDKYLKKVPANREMGLFDILNEDDTDGGVSRHKFIFDATSTIEDENLQTIVEDVATTSKSSKKQKLETNKVRSSIAQFIASTMDVNPKTPLEVEINKYFDANCEEDCETFTWWKKNENDFPNIAKLARATLCIPSTSASSEEAFSSAGSLVTAKRSNLNTLTINRVLFIHDNYEIFKTQQ